MISLKTPLSHEDILKLKVSDKVLLNGTIFTSRDKAHRFLLQEDFEKVRGSIIYHSGPIVKNNEAVSAGPTTSARMNPYTPEVIEKYGIKAIIGKGGMDNGVLEALKGKAVYFSGIGGAGVLYAKSIKIKNVDKLEELGMPEAIWEFEVNDFPVIVTMDANGNSLYEDIKQKSKKVFLKLIE